MKFLYMILLLLVSSPTNAVQLSLAWDDNINDPAIVGGYEIHMGSASANYTEVFDAGYTNQFTVYALNDNTDYYFAALTYPNDPTQYSNSAFSNEVYVHTPDAVWTLDFAASVTTGKRPLVLNFTSITNKLLQTCKWTFGDGGTSTSCDPAHIYNKRGTYTVTLTATDTNNVTKIISKSRYIKVTR